MALNRAIPSLLRSNISRSVICRSLHSAATLKTSTENRTHTGQEFEKGDYRAIRYVDRVKEVNTKFAIDLVDEEPPTEIDGRSYWCDGGGGALGHPKVYINLDEPGPQPCGYCGLRFVQKHHH